MGVVPCDYLVSTQLQFWVVCCWAVTITPKCIETNLTFDNFSLFNNKCFLQTKYRLFFQKTEVVIEASHTKTTYSENTDPIHQTFLNLREGLWQPWLNIFLSPWTQWITWSRTEYLILSLTSHPVSYISPYPSIPPPSYRIVSFILIHKKGLLNYENSSWRM